MVADRFPLFGQIDLRGVARALELTADQLGPR